MTCHGKRQVREFDLRVRPPTTLPPSSQRVFLLIHLPITSFDALVDRTYPDRTGAMPSRIQLDENLWFLYICLQKSDYKAVGFGFTWRAWLHNTDAKGTARSTSAPLGVRRS